VEWAWPPARGGNARATPAVTAASGSASSSALWRRARARPSRRLVSQTIAHAGDRECDQHRALHPFAAFDHEPDRPDAGHRAGVAAAARAEQPALRASVADAREEGEQQLQQAHEPETVEHVAEHCHDRSPPPKHYRRLGRTIKQRNTGHVVVAAPPYV
jgi:hypothetical protein